MTLYRVDVQPALTPNIVAVVTTILTYDWICTLDREVASIWSQPWSLGTCLFILNRYLPFVDIALSIILNWTTSAPEICHRHHVVLMCFVSFGMFLAELILILRTYAIWNRKRSIAICLVILAASTLSALIATITVGVGGLKYGPKKGDHIGCRLIRANNITVFYYITILASETIIVALTIVKTIQHRGSRSTWVRQLSRDGLIFYLFMLGITTANVTLTLVSRSPRYKNILALPQRAFHSIFCNRVILLILDQKTIYTQNDRLPSRYDLFSTTNTSELLSTVVETYATTDLSASHQPNQT